MGCAEQFKLGYFNFVRRVRDRRFVAVDRERGLVMVIAELDEPAGKYATFKLADGREITTGPTRPTTLAVFEVYKIEGGKIRRVEEVQHECPTACFPAGRVMRTVCPAKRGYSSYGSTSAG